MARAKQSKSEAIRAVLAEMGPAVRNRDVIAKLAGSRVAVSAQMVSTVRARLNASGSNGHRLPGRPPRAAAAQAISLSGLLCAKQLLENTGSIRAAKSALEVLSKLQ